MVPSTSFGADHAGEERPLTDLIDDGPQEGKASFDGVYDQPDPCAYYTALGRLDYEIPAHGAEIFATLAEARATRVGRSPKVLDVCCSYGVVPALMNHDVGLDELYDHYELADRLDLDRDELLESDRLLLDDRQRDDAVTVVGLDAAANAVGYAVEAGILERGYAEDLESAAPSPELAEDLEDVDLIVVSGGVGYIGGATFDRLLGAADGPPPWVAALSLRWIDFAPVADRLADHGLVTEHVVEPSFRQRRFADDGERQAALDRLAALGLDPTGKEADGWHHADLFVARPPAEVEALPAVELLGVAEQATLLD